VVWCFFFNDTATTEIYTLSLHDALPISACGVSAAASDRCLGAGAGVAARARSEEHTSELQSRQYLVCGLLLEKKKKEKKKEARKHKTKKSQERSKERKE